MVFSYIHILLITSYEIKQTIIVAMPLTLLTYTHLFHGYSIIKGRGQVI